jgi:hypothetical protein
MRNLLIAHPEVTRNPSPTTTLNQAACEPASAVAVGIAKGQVFCLMTSMSVRRVAMKALLLVPVSILALASGAFRAHAQVTGSGVSHYVPMWTGTTTLGDSRIYQDPTGVGVGTTTPGVAFDVNGAINAATSFNLAGKPFAFGKLASLNAFMGFSGNSTMTGLENTASGAEAMESNTTGNANTAFGTVALLLNSTGSNNTATGTGALELNTTGIDNTATGASALQDNSTGNYNTAQGWKALFANTNGYSNTAQGENALGANTTGALNTAQGAYALPSNTTGYENTGMGEATLLYNTTGSYNTALGYFAGPDSAHTNLLYATAIGAEAVVSQSNAIVLGGPYGGAAFAKVGIGTATPTNALTIANGAGPAISNGWNVYSSRRFKTNIHTLEGALAKVERMRGVYYDQKSDGKRQVGVIAEEVGAVVPEVVTWEANGKDAQSVDYSRLTALLIESTKEQQALIQNQQQQIKTQQAQIDRLTSEMKNVRANLKAGGRTGADVHTMKTAVWISQ